MRFTSFIVAGLAAVASAAMTAQKVADNIQTVTSLSMDLQTPAKSLQVLDGPLLVTGQGNFPPIIRGFQEIVTTVGGYIQQMDNGKTSYAGPDAAIIYDAFRTFVMVHQELLNILIGKAGLFSTVPFIGQPVAAVLRAVEGGVDTLAFSIIDMMQDLTKEMQDSADALGSTLDTCIQSYSGLSL